MFLSVDPCLEPMACTPVKPITALSLPQDSSQNPHDPLPFLGYMTRPKDSLLSPAPYTHTRIQLHNSQRGQWGDGFLSSKHLCHPPLALPSLLSLHSASPQLTNMSTDCHSHQKCWLHEDEGFVLLMAVSPGLQHQLAHSRHSINHLNE